MKKLDNFAAAGYRIYDVCSVLSSSAHHLSRVSVLFTAVQMGVRGSSVDKTGRVNNEAGAFHQPAMSRGYNSDMASIA